MCCISYGQWLVGKSSHVRPIYLIKILVYLGKILASRDCMIGNNLPSWHFEFFACAAKQVELTHSKAPFVSSLTTPHTEHVPFTIKSNRGMHGIFITSLAFEVHKQAHGNHSSTRTHHCGSTFQLIISILF